MRQNFLILIARNCSQSTNSFTGYTYLISNSIYEATHSLRASHSLSADWRARLGTARCRIVAIPQSRGEATAGGGDRLSCPAEKCANHDAQRQLLPRSRPHATAARQPVMGGCSMHAASLHRPVVLSQSVPTTHASVPTAHMLLVNKHIVFMCAKKTASVLYLFFRPFFFMLVWWRSELLDLVIMLTV